MMKDALRFNADQYEIKTCSLDGRSVTYRAFMGLEYCEKRVDPIQKLNLFVPEIYYQGGKIRGWSLSKAPVFMPNTVGGYMPGPADEPGIDHHGHPNSVFQALEHGYVVASAGVRGRTTGKRSTEFFEGAKAELSGEDTGRMVGRAPALIVDLKAAVRYLRHNRTVIPGNTERIITNGTSAGGALSALAGATGNSPDYEPYLRAIGAAQERDDIFAASCYCPIHNLENADAAYEWLFCGCNDFHCMKHVKTEHGIERVPCDGQMTEKQTEISVALKKLFPAYLNSLGLKDEEGKLLTLDEDGEGSFQKYVPSFVLAAAQKELDTHHTAKCLDWLAVAGSAVEEQSYLKLEDGKAADMDWKGFVKAITRMKEAPAFDALPWGLPHSGDYDLEELFAWIDRICSR